MEITRRLPTIIIFLLLTRPKEKYIYIEGVIGYI